ncbi:hypothetical protein AURDEDRAFT_186158 [Auricularia subglabra TFB-10046 SS5]|nr:hypothetical protein AURDEDRAFT_186158 [Auricularia subglabra TFB-10046 SS5]
MPMLRKRDASPMYFPPWAQLSHELLGDRDGHTPALVEIMTRCRKLRAVAAPTHALKTGERVFHISSAYSKPSSTLRKIHLRGPGVTEHRIPFQDVVVMLGFFSHEPLEELYLSNYWCDQPKGGPARSASITPFPRLRRFAFESCWIHEEGMELLLLGTQAPIAALELRFTAHLVVNIHGIVDLAHKLPALRELAFFHHETRKLLDFSRLEIFETRGPTRRDFLMVYPPPNIHTLRLRHTTPRIDAFYWVADIASQLLMLYLPRCRHLRRVEIHVPSLQLTALATWRTAALVLDYWFPNLQFCVHVQLVRTRLVLQKTRMQRLFGT